MGGASGARTPRLAGDFHPAGQNRLAQPSSSMLHMYVSSVSDVSDVCCNCFHLDVANVDRGMLHMLHMLQVFSEACCKGLFKMFYLFPDVCCNYFFI